MNDQILKMLQDLATKLGTTMDHLWLVLVKQAPIAAAQHLIFGLVLIAIWWVFFHYHNKFSQPWKKKYDEDSYTIYDKDDGVRVAPMFLFFVALFISTLIWTCHAYTEFSGFFNPEYWALQELRRLM